MIESQHGDLLQADAEALVNAVNCVGVMGRGIALSFRKTFPENFKVYKAACEAKQLAPGKMLICELPTNGNPRYVINFSTKRHWKDKSRIEDIEARLAALVAEIKSRNFLAPQTYPNCGGLLRVSRYGWDSGSEQPSTTEANGSFALVVRLAYARIVPAAIAATQSRTG